MAVSLYLCSYLYPYPCPGLFWLPPTRQVPAVRLVNEAYLVALATGVENGIIIDVGETRISVTPVFDRSPVHSAVQTENVGGGDITRYLDHMLVSRARDGYNKVVRIDNALSLLER